jgi:curli biogenesis system outer membrane secretion channel CsgG
MMAKTIRLATILALALLVSAVSASPETAAAQDSTQNAAKTKPHHAVHKPAADSTFGAPYDASSSGASYDSSSNGAPLRTQPDTW